MGEGRVPRTGARELRQVREEATVAVTSGSWGARLSPILVAIFCSEWSDGRLVGTRSRIRAGCERLFRPCFARGLLPTRYARGPLPPALTAGEMLVRPGFGWAGWRRGVVVKAEQKKWVWWRGRVRTFVLGLLRSWTRSRSLRSRAPSACAHGRRDVGEARLRLGWLAPRVGGEGRTKSGFGGEAGCERLFRACFARGLVSACEPISGVDGGSAKGGVRSGVVWWGGWRS